MANPIPSQLIHKLRPSFFRWQPTPRHGTQDVMISLDTVEHPTFEALQGQAFTVTTSQGITSMNLASISLLGHRHPHATRDPFSLTFRAPSGTMLPQGIYRFEHEATGAFEIFIAQLGNGPQGADFEAVFT